MNIVNIEKKTKDRYIIGVTFHSGVEEEIPCDDFGVSDAFPNCLVYFDKERGDVPTGMLNVDHVAKILFKKLKS